jgi:hypothetical protein
VKTSTVIRTACAAVAAAFLLACGAGTTPEAEPSSNPTVGIVSGGPVTSLDTPPAPAPTSAKPAPAKTAVTFGDGIWQIPGEVKPGTYRTVVPADSWNCYYEIVKDFSGDIRSIIDNGNQEPGLPQIITIPKTAKGIDVGGCGTWTKIK